MSSRPTNQQLNRGRMPSISKKKTEYRETIDFESIANLQITVEELQHQYASMELATVMQLTEQRLKPRKQISLGYIVESFDFPVHPDGYCPYTTVGDGLCFVHSLVRTVIMYWYSIGGVEQVELWKMQFLDWMMHTIGLHPSCQVDMISFVNPPDGNLDVENVLLKNELFFNVLVYNVMYIMTSIWKNPDFHRIPAEQFQYGIPDISYALGMAHRHITAVDGLARNLVMGILGVHRIEVIQPYTHTNTGENVVRVATPAQQLTVRMVNDMYRGYIIDKNDIPCIFNPFDITLSVMMYSRNSSHYDMYLSIKSGQVATPTCMITERLPACTRIITSADVPREAVIINEKRD